MYVYTLPRRIVADIVKTLHAEAKRQEELSRQYANGRQQSEMYEASRIAGELDNLAQEMADSIALVVVSPRTD
jgi:hypothetical protein